MEPSLTSDAIGKCLPPDGIETDQWDLWPEAKLTQEERMNMVSRMPLCPGGRPHPQDLSQARVLMIYQAIKNGFRIPDDIQTE